MKQSDLIASSAITASVVTYIFAVILQIYNVDVYTILVLSLIEYLIVASLTMRLLKK